MLEHWWQIISKCWNIGARVADWPPIFDGILFSALGPILGHNVQHLLVTWGRLKSFFCISPLMPGVKYSELISTFARIGMLDLGWTLALTPSVKWALWSCHSLEVSQSYFRVSGGKVIVAATHREIPTLKSYVNRYVDADVEGEESQSHLTLFLPPNLQNRKIFKKCQRWLTISSKKPQITPVDIVFRFMIQYNSLRDFGP
jgi:hypothetical protein